MGKIRVRYVRNSEEEPFTLEYQGKKVDISENDLRELITDCMDSLWLKGHEGRHR